MQDHWAPPHISWHEKRMMTVMTISWLQLHTLTLSMWDLGIKIAHNHKNISTGLTYKPDRDPCLKIHSHGHQWHPQDFNRRLVPHLALRTSVLEFWQSHTTLSSLAPVAQPVTQMQSCKCGSHATPQNSITIIFFVRFMWPMAHQSAMARTFVSLVPHNSNRFAKLVHQNHDWTRTFYPFLSYNLGLTSTSASRNVLAHQALFVRSFT